MNATWKHLDKRVATKRAKYAALKKARICPKCGGWMRPVSDYIYECPTDGARKLRGRA